MLGNLNRARPCGFSLHVKDFTEVVILQQVLWQVWTEVNSAIFRLYLIAGICSYAQAKSRCEHHCIRIVGLDEAHTRASEL